MSQVTPGHGRLSWIYEPDLFPRYVYELVTVGTVLVDGRVMILS